MPGTSVYDFVFGIERDRGVRNSECLEGCVHEMGGVIDEVFRSHDCKLTEELYLQDDRALLEEKFMISKHTTCKL